MSAVSAASTVARDTAPLAQCLPLCSAQCAAILASALLLTGAFSFAQTENIVGVAAGNENFSTLVAAVKAADLVGTLNSEGPFTVFAPTNEAFAKLPEGTVENLLKPENKALLSSVLTYHVVAGKFMAADVLKAIADNNGKFVITTVNGEELTAYTKKGKVMLKDAKGNTSTIILTDVEASNGIIHAIDSVVMP